MKQHQEETSKTLQANFMFQCEAISPKIIIDEYLMAERVVNPNQPIYV